MLPMFSKQLIDYTEGAFKESKIDIMTKTMVKEIKEKSVVLKMPDGQVKDVPCGMVVWAAVRPMPLVRYTRLTLNINAGKRWTPSHSGPHGSAPISADQQAWHHRRRYVL